MRIAIGGIMHESNTFATTKADRQRFVAGSLAFGAELLPVWREAHHEVGGFIAGAAQFGYELVPTVMAWATPSGPTDDAVLDEVVEKIISMCQEQPIDGLLLALHGAMVTPKFPSADTEVLRRVRNALGTKLPISVTLDFHANCAPQMAEYANALVGYQTYPHIDQRQRGLLASELLVRTIRGEIHPVTYIAKRPLIANILGQGTDRDPMRALMKAARECEQLPKLLSASVMGGFQYADVPDMGPAIITVADGDLPLAKQTAEKLAEQMWQVRQEFAVPCPSPAEAVRMAMAEERGPVLLIDLGDNIGGGSAGDGTVILTELLRQKATDFIVVLYAPQAVKRCLTIGVNGQFSGMVGGQVDRLHGEPVPLQGVTLCLHDGKWLETEARHGGRRQNDQGATIVLRLAGNNTVVLNSLQTPPFSLGQLTSLGLKPEKAKIIVVKAALAYKAAYAPLSAKIIEVDTPGATAVNPAHFEYRHLRECLYPLAEKKE